MVKGSKIRLALIDDHPIVELGVRMAVNKYKSANIDFCAYYDLGKTALEKIENDLIDVILLDLMLPDLAGEDILKRLFENNPDYKVGIFSSTSDIEKIVSVFEQGALGFLSKSGTAEEIIEFISTLAKGEMYIRGEITKVLMHRERISPPISKIVQLTNREEHVFNLIINGYKTKEIANKLHISDRTVEFHKQNIYHKYGVSDALNLTQMAMNKENGWIHNFGKKRYTDVPLS